VIEHYFFIRQNTSTPQIAARSVPRDNKTTTNPFYDWRIRYSGAATVDLFDSLPATVVPFALAFSFLLWICRSEFSFTLNNAGMNFRLLIMILVARMISVSPPLQHLRFLNWIGLQSTSQLPSSFPVSFLRKIPRVFCANFLGIRSIPCAGQLFCAFFALSSITIFSLFSGVVFREWFSKIAVAANSLCYDFVSQGVNLLRLGLALVRLVRLRQQACGPFVF
jgi:hypothetical protein